ncbi:SDR family NAD(P)-dependent oxidoreductase [Flavobacterium sp. MAH-1]|uniref:Probable oxidoreductase n=1 Tax=Flavobacterium agri TaxID=2743471 RepID=A0A7Y8XZ80_9FLAO|nr:SDR family NAD(P)-dependent oxidoreductase [Flavobacterium agri]NUY79617.1 SDR family NAD(P)-dependent oxidoreductase [Flavobacterium agri]NYA69642.1 SDR family NAD(P)-dependent oxidoreductase [Flavobacterium agri]
MSLIKTKFGFQSKASEIIDGIDLSGKNVIVTGANSGIGIETARAMAQAGASVTLAVRDISAGEKAAREIRSTTGNRDVEVRHLDLSRLESVNEFVGQWTEPLHVLINNAGVMALPELQKTSFGIEMQFMTNYLGHFALTRGLHPFLRQTVSARVVMVSSSGHLLSPVVFGDVNFDFRPYDAWNAYAQSKTACILFAIEADKRWADDGIRVNALNPGAIQTNLQKYVGGKLQSKPEFHKTPQQGAATSVLLAASPLLDGIGGRYFENSNEAPTVYKRPAIFEGVAHYALDKEEASKLWNVSKDFIRV